MYVVWHDWHADEVMRGIIFLTSGVICTDCRLLTWPVWFLLAAWDTACNTDLCWCIKPERQIESWRFLVVFRECHSSKSWSKSSPTVCVVCSLVSTLSPTYRGIPIIMNICVHLTCGVVCTDWTTWVGTPGAGGLESDKLSLEGTESSVDETQKVKEKGFIWRSGTFNWKPIHHRFKRSTHDRLVPNRNNSHHRTSRNQVSFFALLRKDGQWGGGEVCLSNSHFILISCMQKGQPWTANLPRWREKSLHLVNMEIRWEGKKERYVWVDNSGRK